MTFDDWYEHNEDGLCELAYIEDVDGDEAWQQKYYAKYLSTFSDLTFEDWCDLVQFDFIAGVSVSDYEALEVEYNKTQERHHV